MKIDLLSIFRMRVKKTQQEVENVQTTIDQIEKKIAIFKELKKVDVLRKEIKTMLIELLDTQKYISIINDAIDNISDIANGKESNDKLLDMNNIEVQQQEKLNA